MTAAQAAQQDNRDGGGRYAEQPHADPGGTVLAGGLDFDTADPDGTLNETQRAYVSLLAGLMAAPGKLRVEQSCHGQRYVCVEADPADVPGTITQVSCLFWGGNQRTPDEVSVVSSWTWPEKIGSYDSQAVVAQLVPADSYDQPTIEANMARLAGMQVWLDEKLNKPVLRRDQTVHGTTVDAHMYDRFGATQLDLYIGDGRDVFTIGDGQVVKADIQTTRYGQLSITDSRQLDTVMAEVGRTLSLNVPGIDLPDWSLGRPARRQVEYFLIAEGA